MTLKESWFKTINKNIKLAKNAGFCYGVKRAVDTTINLKLKNPKENICVLGELIHNSHVISYLKSLGISTINKIPNNGCGYCIIRSHGQSAKTFDEIKNSGFNVVDLTCPDVKKVQNKAKELAILNYLVLILGKKEHPEVQAIYSDTLEYAHNKNDIYIISSLDELKLIEDKIKLAKKVGVVLQTTQTIEYLISIVDYLSNITKILKVENTICPSTALRQQEAKRLASQSDLMVVVGSKKSANTTHLANILSVITKTIHIEDENELNQYSNLINKVNNIGITAGASTPDDIIKKVINKLERTK